MIWRLTLLASAASALAPARRPLQVVVDVDDTVKSSGNLRLLNIPLGGIDGQYARGAFYPAVDDFVAELALAHGGAPEPVAVLTARAKEFKFALALDADDAVVKRFADCGRRKGMAGWGVAYDRVLYGSFHEWIFQDFKGWRKFANFQKLLSALGDLDDAPKRRYVFVGDTGELDGQAAELMAARYPDRVAAVFLHAVGPDGGGRGVEVPRDYDVAGVPVRFFRTYVGAARAARALGLLDAGACARVADAAFRDLGDDRESNRRSDVEADASRLDSDDGS